MDFTLDKRIFTAERLIQNDSIANLKISTRDSILSSMANSLILQIVAEVATRKTDSKAVSYPTTWWDSVKIRFLPAWALKRWPAKMTTVTLEAWAHYPSIAIPDTECYVTVSIIGDMAKW